MMELGEGGEWDEVLGAQWGVAGWRRGISMAQAELRLGGGIVGRWGVG